MENQSDYEKEVKYNYEGGDEVIYLNQTQFYQLVSNLVDNAIKYNDKTKPVINISTSIKDETFELIIEDNGPGIPKEFRSKVLELFQTLHNSKRVDSTGIGLSIVNKIVTKQNGTVTITDSKELGGAKFVVTIPNEKNVN